MLNLGIIGIGNCGNQVAALAKEELACDVLAINSSENDLSSVPDSVPKLMIGDERGAGKNRREAKLFLKDGIVKLIEDKQFRDFILSKDAIFIVSSTGGGTGSGMAPMLSKIIRESFVSPSGEEKIVILVGVAPKLSEAYSTQVNSLEYLTELYDTISDATYMLYDNEKMSKDPTHIMMKSINQEIVDDIKILGGYYNTKTPYSSIDEKDTKMILQTPGRIVLSQIYDIKEKDLDEMDLEDYLIERLKKNNHAEIDRNKVVQRTGIITNLSEIVNNTFDTHITKVQDFIGSPVEEFEHVVINEDRKMPNNVFLIMAGLTPVNDRIRKINDRIEEINEAQKALEEENALKEAGSIEELNQKRQYREKKDTKELDISNIFGSFGV